jgi:hypothetical protein
MALWTAAVLVLAGSSIVVGRDVLLKAAMIRIVRASTGLDIRLDRIQTRLRHPSLRILGLSVENPPGYPAGEAIRVEEFFAEIVPGSIGSGTNHFREIRLVIPELIVLEDGQGGSNLKVLSERMKPGPEPALAPESAGRPVSALPVAPTNSVSAGPAPAPAGKPAPAAASNPGTPILIDALTVKLGVLEYRFPEKNGVRRPPRRIVINGDTTVRNVTNLDRASGEIAMTFFLQAAPEFLDAIPDVQTPPP